MGAAPASLLPELEEVVQHGSAEKRAETLRRITGLFLDGASAFKDEHVAVFDLAVVLLTAFLDEHLTVFREHIVGADE